MASIGSLIIDLIAKTGAFETDLGRAARTAEKRSKEIDRSISRMGSRITNSLAAIGVGFSFAQIIKATSEAEKALAALDNAVRNNAGAAGVTTKQLEEFSGELQRLTTFSDDSIQGMQALLLTFRQIGGGEFERAQVAVLDLATALGKDLNSSALLVGRALADPIKGMTALGRAGVVLSKEQQGVIKSLVESGRSAEAQGIILQQLESRFGGAAKAARDTFGGALDGLKNALGDLLEVKGGLPGVTTAINNVTEALSSEDVKQSADSFGSAIISALTAIGSTAVAVLKPLVKIINAAASLGTQMDMALGRDFDTGTQLNVIGEKLEALEILRDSLLHPQGDPGALIGPHELEQVQRLSKEIDLLKGKRDALQYEPGSSSGPSRRRTPAFDIADAVPSEEFTKLAEKLNEQIALHGKVGEAAKLAYAIQSGALEGLSDAEEKQLLALARRADAVAASTEAQKKAAEEQKKALADQDQARESIESMVSALQQQVATYDQGEAAVIRYRVEHGDLADTFSTAGAAADPYKQELIRLTEEMEALTEATKRQDEAQKEWEAAVAKGAAITESVRTPLETYQETLGELNDALDLGVISQETYSRALEKAQESLDEATNKWTVFKDQAARNTQDIIADTLVNGFDKGAKGILDSFADMITKLAAQAIAADIAGKLFGKSGGGEGEGWIGALFGAASSGSGGTSGGGWIDALASFFGGGRAFGGPVTAGTMYRVNERESEFFKPNIGGKVIPLSKMQGAGGSVTNSSITQNITVAGRADLRTARQIQIEASRQQRIATARLG